MAISCRVTRGDLTESIHVAFAVAVDKNGQIFFSSGDPNYLTCIRSSLKPFQAAASIKGRPNPSPLVPVTRQRICGCVYNDATSLSDILPCIK